MTQNSDTELQKQMLKILFDKSYDNIFGRIENNFSQSWTNRGDDNFLYDTLLNYLKSYDKEKLFEEMYTNLPFLVSFILLWKE